MTRPSSPVVRKLTAWADLAQARGKDLGARVGRSSPLGAVLLPRQNLETFLVVLAEGEMEVVTSVQWVEIKVATKHPAMHRTAPMTKDYPVQNVRKADVEKP